MAKKKDFLVLGLLGAAAAYLVYDTFIKGDRATTQPTAPTPPIVPIAPVVPAVKVPSYPIGYMDYHPDIKKLQAIVGVTQDGVLGPKTVAAIHNIDWQFNEGATISSADALNNYGYKLIQLQYNG